MNGYGFYDYVVNFTAYGPKGIKELHPVRIWLWENYGPSLELQAARDPELKWSWDTDHDNRRLYLKEDVLVLFKLKWL